MESTYKTATTFRVLSSLHMSNTSLECDRELTATAEQSCATQTIPLTERTGGIHTLTTQPLNEILVDWDGPGDPENPRK